MLDFFLERLGWFLQLKIVIALFDISALLFKKYIYFWQKKLYNFASLGNWSTHITIHNWKGLCTLFWKWNKKYVLRFTNLFKDENIQTQILDAALKFVPEHGWTKTAIENGIDEMKLPKISAGIISNGPIDLVHHHYEKSNNLLGKINIITSLHSVNEWIEFRVTFVVTKGQIKSEWI